MKKLCLMAIVALGNARLPMACLAAVALFAFATNTNAAIVFSNDFEDGNLNPEIGTWTFGASSTTSVVALTAGPDATLGINVGLLDLDTLPLDLTFNLTNTASLASGGTVTLDFDVAARRTNGNAKTIFVDALDSSGDIVTRFVLGDSNAFGNGGGDRQRPGYDPVSTGVANTGNSIFPAGTGTVPGSFWIGGDGNSGDGFNGNEAHMSLTIGASSFDFSSTSTFGGMSYSTTTGISNYDGGTYADIAEFKLSSAGAGYGMYFDNISVVAVPEPSSFAVFGLSALGLCGFRRRKA